MEQSYSLYSESAKNLSSSHDEIEVAAGSNKIYIVIKDNNLCYKRSKIAEAECLGVPVDTIIAFAGQSHPSGYLPCDGRQLYRSKYSDIFKAIGTTSR